MSGTLAKHSNALGWAWYLDTDEGSYWVSHPVKEHIDSLEAENAKLKEELEAVGTAAYLYGRSDLKIENAKLRELLLELYEDQCDDCDRWKYRDRMCELEVDV